MHLDLKGRCPNCLRKPIPYHRQQHFFCRTCCRQFNMATGDQEPNWAWRAVGNDRWEPTYPVDGSTGQYALAKPTVAAIRRS